LLTYVNLDAGGAVRRGHLRAGRLGSRKS